MVNSQALPLISIVIVNYNGKDSLRESLFALCSDQDSPSFEVIVVDNASPDGSVKIAEDLQKKYPSLSVLSNKNNHGYAGGVNCALPLARGKYIAVLNMDTIVSPGWLCSPVSFLEENPKVAAVSPLLVLEEDENRVNAAGQNIHVSALGFNRGLGQNRFELPNTPFQVSAIHGGAFIIRKSILDETEGLDDSGFLYNEEIKISWLLQIMGFDLYCIPDSVVKHKYYLSMFPTKLYLYERNRLAMLFTYLNISTVVVLMPFLFITEFMMWVYCFIRGYEFVKAKYASYRWVVSKRNEICNRRNKVKRFRRETDWHVIKRLSWNYPWDQFVSLAFKKQKTERQPAGGIPVVF